MRGKISILNYGPGISYPEAGDWDYEDGVMMRGMLKKESINLTALLMEIQETPGGNYQNFIADVNSSSSFMKAAIFSGSNIVGLMNRSARIKKINSLPLFNIILKDGRKLLASSEKSILRELLGFEGVNFKTWSQIEKDIKN